MFFGSLCPASSSGVGALCTSLVPTMPAATYAQLSLEEMMQGIRGALRYTASVASLYAAAGAAVVGLGAIIYYGRRAAAPDLAPHAPIPPPPAARPPVEHPRVVPDVPAPPPPVVGLPPQPPLDPRLRDEIRALFTFVNPHVLPTRSDETLLMVCGIIYRYATNEF